MNNFSLIKKDDEDSLLIHSFPYVYYNLKSNDSKIFNNDNLLIKIQKMINRSKKWNCKFQYKRGK